MENSAKKTKRQKTIELRQKRQQDLLLEKFRETHIVSVACKKAGVPKATYYRWKEDLEFSKEASDALFEGRENTNDFVESQLMKKISEGNMHGIKYFLGHNKKEYMYRPDLIAHNEKHDEIEKVRHAFKMMISSTKENTELAKELEALKKINEELKNERKNEAIEGNLEG